MSFALRKIWLAAGATIAAGVTLAAFTSPPFNSQPTRTVPMVWQCYSALVERTSAVCATAPAHPSNVIPARTHWYLVQCKASVRSMVNAGKWTHPALDGYHTNRLNETNLLAFAGVGQDFWTNTPPAGMSTATNGWNGFRRVITNLIWSIEHGAPSDCNGQNQYGYRSGFWCATNQLSFTHVTNVPMDGGFPLYEGRHYVTPTNVIYHYSIVQDFIEDGSACDEEDWGYYGSNEYFGCTAPVEGVTTNTDWECVTDPETGSSSLRGDKIRSMVTLHETITDPCAPGYALGEDCAGYTTSIMCARVAPIAFPTCASALTNQLFSAEEWYNSGATGTCATTATWNNPFSASLSSIGWANVFSYSSTNGADLCRTNFATARTPWDGLAVNYAWAIYDAVMVKKWNFNY